jgi:HTH-type transcriptional regulator/antitoxin HigA
MQIITNEQELIATKNQINSILDQRNITQDDRDIVLDILNGKRQLTANQIQDLAVFFQIDPTYLVA